MNEPNSSSDPTGLRFLYDADGVEWTVWEVMPGLRVPRSTTGTSLPPLPDELREGWLTLQSNTERRRVAPAPSGWNTMSDADLLALLQASELTKTTRRTK